MRALNDQLQLNTNYWILSSDALSIVSLWYKHSLWLFFVLCSFIIIIPPHPPRSKTELRPGPGPDRAGGEGRAVKTLQKQSTRTWECTQVIFVWGDQKAFTFRCFSDMNIQHPYWNLIWVSFSQGSFHQCLLPGATADWRPNFRKERVRGKKGEDLVVLEIWAVWAGGTDEWRGAEAVTRLG